MQKVKAILQCIDGISEWTGKIVAWFVLFMTLEMAYEVIARYFFNAPTKWAFDVSYMLGGTFFLLGACYTLRHGEHVRIDIFYSRFSPRTKGIVDVILTLLIFFPAWGILLWKLIPYVYHSWMIQEKALESFWRPPIYPFKTVMPIGVFLLLLQGTAEFIRSLFLAVRGKPL